MEILEQRHGISPDIFLTIHWQSMRFALRKLSQHRRATALKAIHRHLPTHEKLFKQGQLAMNSLCTHCLQAEETNSHMYCCMHDVAYKQRKEDWGELWKQLQKKASIIEQMWRYY